MTTIASQTRRVLHWIAAMGMGAILLLQAASASAADTNGSQGFQISSPTNDITLDPGTSTKQTIKVNNLTDQQITLAVGKSNFTAKGDEGEVNLVDGDVRYSLSDYFNVGQSSVVVPPRGSAQVSYTIDVPANAEPGGRYGSVTFTAAPGTLAPGQSGASVRQEIAALIFLRISGTTNEQLKIDSFKPSKSLAEYGPINFATVIEDVGSVHEVPTGEIVVKNMFGWKTATIKLDQKLVLPGASRLIDSTLNRHWMFGHYSATLTLHNGTQQTLTATTSFTVIPWKVVLIVLVVLFLLGWMLRRTRKRFGRAFRILAGRE